MKSEDLARELQALFAKGLLQEAGELCRQAVAERPGVAELWRLSGITALRAADFEGAVACFKEAVRLAPKSPVARSALASALLRKGDRQEARRELETALSLDPRRAQDVESLASVLLKSGEAASARALLSNALALGLKCPNACALMASAELDAGDVGAASKLFVLAASWSPSAFLAIENVALSLMGKAAFEEARLVLAPVAKAFPDKVELLVNLAVCQMQTGRFDECFESFAAAAKLAPEAPAYLVNYGSALGKAGRQEESISVLKKALALEPSNYHASLALSLGLLKLGRLAEGWPHWESRLKQPDLAKLSKCELPLWTPEAPASARVLVRCEQGFGDSVFFARFLPLLRARCAHLSFICRKELLRLFEGFQGIDRLLPLDGDETSPRDCDFRIPLASLPRYFASSMETLPSLEKPLFKPAGQELSRWRSFVEPRAPGSSTKRIGLCWSGSQENRLGRMRSIPAKELLPLLSLPGTAFFSLQADAMEAELDVLARADGLPFIACASTLRDFADTAALIESLDVVVSVDTAVAHLAGSALKPVKLALCFESDWRWFEGRSDSPWYPSFELFRQTERGSWSGVVQAIAASLRA